jgi:hypothetical protein
MHMRVVFVPVDQAFAGHRRASDIRANPELNACSARGWELGSCQGTVLAPTAARSLIDQFAALLPYPGQQLERQALFGALTDRERTVFSGLAAGKSHREIGLLLRPNLPRGPGVAGAGRGRSSRLTFGAGRPGH